MNNEKEPSLKQRNMLIAYQDARRDIDWPTLECAMEMLRFGANAIVKVFPKCPPNSPRSHT